MGLSKNGIKRWPGQLSNTLEEVKHADSRQKIESLLDEADQLKRSLVGEQKNSFPGKKRASLGADPSRRAPAGEDGSGMNEVLEGVAHGIRSWKNYVREQPWFEDVRRLVGVGLWETLSFLQLHRLRDSAMENLGLVSSNGRMGKSATRRQGDKASMSSTGLTLLVL